MMALSSKRLCAAGKLGERLAAGDETALEDIRSVIEPIIRAGDDKDGLAVIMQILVGTVPADVFDAMCDRQLARLQAGARDPRVLMRDQTEAASIRRLLAPKPTS